MLCYEAISSNTQDLSWLCIQELGITSGPVYPDTILLRTVIQIGTPLALYAPLTFPFHFLYHSPYGLYVEILLGWVEKGFQSGFPSTL